MSSKTIEKGEISILPPLKEKIDQFSSEFFGKGFYILGAEASTVENGMIYKPSGLLQWGAKEKRLRSGSHSMFG